MQNEQFFPHSTRVFRSTRIRISNVNDCICSNVMFLFDLKEAIGELRKIILKRGYFWQCVHNCRIVFSKFQRNFGATWWMMGFCQNFDFVFRCNVMVILLVFRKYYGSYKYIAQKYSGLKRFFQPSNPSFIKK